MRIGVLWIKTKDGKKVTSGEISSDSGINLPAGGKLFCRLVHNDKKQPGDKYPDFYIEAWFPEERGQKSDAGTTGKAPAAASDEDIPF